MAVPAYPSIYPLGDSAVTLDLGNFIDEQHNALAVSVRDWLEAHRFPGVCDILVAYSSVSLLYDPAKLPGGWAGQGTLFARCKALMEEAWRAVEAGRAPRSQGGAGSPTVGGSGARGMAWENGRSLRIPVCYERGYAPDLSGVAARVGMTEQEVVDIHSAAVYRVFMIGFLPGFAYMGKLDERLQVPRKIQPVNVTAGGVGIAGVQTGIYPLNSPGGWHIIGRTPVALFDADANPPVRLQSGDHVQFYPVSSAGFRQLAGRPD